MRWKGGKEGGKGAVQYFDPGGAVAKASFHRHFFCYLTIFFKQAQMMVEAGRRGKRHRGDAERVSIATST